MSLSRRRLLTAGSATLAFGGFARLAAAQDPGAGSATPYRNEVEGYGPLLRDPGGLLDLPEGFGYRVISRAGETMDDGLLVPGKADGMGCIALGGSRVALVRNHELNPARDADISAAGPGLARAGLIDSSKAFDTLPDGDTALFGGTTTIVYDLAAQRTLRQHLSLTGTIINCAGGVTPWGSWLTCEEHITGVRDGLRRDHGWVFEVPANAEGLVQAEPLTAMGRFQHEAACVDPRTGIVYLTEDSFDHKGLFYRFLPEVPGELSRGGRLQALGFRDTPTGGDSRNLEGRVSWRPGDWRDAVWIDLDEVHSPEGDLRLRGHARGAALFARGEGVHFGAGELYFTCTSGGVAGMGQIMRYVPSADEGQAGETGGRLQLFYEASDDAVYDYGDNITVAPWGHLLVCEDRYTDEPNHLRGVTPEGKVYTVARNILPGNAELAGACFSPDGETLFLNIYSPGITLAIRGPWSRFRNS